MKSKWLLALLVLSLALNLALVGFLLGRSSAGFAGGDPTRGFPRWAMMEMSPERREALRPALSNERANMRRQLRGLREHHQSLRSAVAATPFDAAALDAALADMRSAYAQVESANHAAFREFVTQLTTAERQQLARQLERQHPRRPRPRPGGR